MARPLNMALEYDRGTRPQGEDGVVAAVFVGVGLAVSLLYGALSDGVHHLDDLTHFLIAKWAWTWPSYLVHNWGRPGFTVLYWLPAGLGWHAARALSAVLSAAAAWMAFRIAQAIGVRRAWVVPLFLYLEPRFFTLSLTTLTETAMAVYLTAAILLILRDRWVAAAIVFSPGLCARHEAVIFVPIFILAAWSAGQPLRKLVPIVWAPVVVNLLAWVAGQPLMIGNYGRAAGTGVYGSGGWYEFFARSQEAFGPAIAALGFVGIAPVLRRRGGVIVAACAMAFFVTHMLIRMFGVFDSGGYARFLVPIGPLWAIMAVAAWNRLLSRDAQVRAQTGILTAGTLAFLWIAMELQVRAAQMARHWSVIAAEYPDLTRATWAIRVITALAIMIAVIAWLLTRGGRSPVGPTSLALRVLLAGAMLLAWGSICGVLRPNIREIIADEEIAWLRLNGYRDRKVESASIWVDYRLDTPLHPSRARFAQRIDAAPPGAIILWDSHFAPSEEQPPVPADALFTRPDQYFHLHRGRDIPGSGPAFHIFEKLRKGGGLTEALEAQRK